MQSKRGVPLSRETAESSNPINMSKRDSNSHLSVFKCFVFHMVSICIFVKELIYVFQLLWPPNNENHRLPGKQLYFYCLLTSPFTFHLHNAEFLNVEIKTNEQHVGQTVDGVMGYLSPAMCLV